MIDRCHTYRGAHIPGCMGCAVYGHHRCTCKSSSTALLDRMQKLERRVARLERGATKGRTP